MNPTIDQIIRWALDYENASGQIQKAYDWKIAQLSALATAFLTATFAILSSALLEYYKRTVLLPHWEYWVGGNCAVYLLIYIFCRFRIEKLREEFLAVYTLLLAIK